MSDDEPEPRLEILPPKLIVLAPGEWLGEPHTMWFAIEYRSRIVALFFGEAWRVLDDGLQIIAESTSPQSPTQHHQTSGDADV